MGGSGGYVFIHTNEVGDSNKFDPYARLQCIGGYGKNKGHGGSGGIMFFSGTNAAGLNNTRINGGLGDKGWFTARFGTNAASGTAYWKKLDTLLIDNGYHRSDKKTSIRVIKGRATQYYRGENMVAHNLYFRKYANVSIEGENLEHILLPVLDMNGMARVDFNFRKSAYMVMKYHTHLNLGYGTMLDFSKIAVYTRIECQVEKGATKFGSVKLGGIKFSRSFKIADHTNDLTVQNTVEDTYADIKERGYIELYSKTIRLYYSAKIKA